MREVAVASFAQSPSVRSASGRMQSIKYFRPTGEPDAEYDSYKEYL